MTHAAPPPESPTTSDPFGPLGTTSAAVIRAVGFGAGVYAAAWLFGLVLTTLVRVASQDDPFSWSWLVTGPGQLTAMSVFSPLSFGSSGEEFDFALDVTAAPLVLLAFVLTAAAWSARRDESRSPTDGRGVLVLGAATGLSFAIVTWLIALVLKPTEDGGSASAASWQTWILGTLLVGGASVLGRRRFSDLQLSRTWPAELFAAGRAVTAHLAVFGALSVPAAMVIMVVEGEPLTILTIPLLLLNGVAYAATLGHLGALSVSSDFFDELGDFSGTVWLFGEDTPRSLLTFLPLAVVAWFVASLVLAVRSRGTVRTTAGWICTPLIYAVVGGAICILPRIWISAGGFGTSVGPAAWFFLVFAAWGLAAEAVSRSVAPLVVGRIPQNVVLRLNGTPSERTAVQQPAPASTSAEPLSRRSKVLLGAGAGLLAILVVAFIAVSVVNSARFGPDREAKAYLQAVAAGRADDALDRARLSVKGNERVLLTDEILKASKDRIEDISIGDVDVSGDEATTTARFTLEGAELSADLTLVKDGSRWGVFDRWVVENPGLGTIYLTAPGAESLRVNGVEVPVDGLDEGVSLPAFPATYVIEPSTGSSLISYGSETVTLAGDEEDLEFEAAPSPDMKQKVTSAALDFLRECLKSKEGDPDGCPNETFYSDLTNVSWKLIEEPTFTIESDYEGGFQFSTENAGTAKITASEEPFFEGDSTTPYDEEVSIDFSGSIRIDGDDVTIEVDDSYF